jgi:SAM-dependent methyltransferase
MERRGITQMPEKSQDDFSCLKRGYEGVGAYYDLFADNSDIPFYIRMAKAIGSPILELAAGTARVSLALAQEGFEVSALEKSPSMLAAARSKLKDAPQDVSNRITVIEGDMEQFELGQQYALIIIPNSFGHALTKNAQLSVLGCVQKHLRDDGVFILDLYIGEMLYSHAAFEDPLKQLGDGTTVERQGEIHTDTEHHLMKMDIRYTKRNAQGLIQDIVEVTSGAALILEDEIAHLLHQTNLDVIEEFGGFDSSPFSSDSSRRIMLLRKVERR